MHTQRVPAFTLLPFNILLYYETASRNPIETRKIGKHWSLQTNIWHQLLLKLLCLCRLWTKCKYLVHLSNGTNYELLLTYFGDVCRSSPGLRRSVPGSETSSGPSLGPTSVSGPELGTGLERLPSSPEDDSQEVQNHSLLTQHHCMSVIIQSKTN